MILNNIIIIKMFNLMKWQFSLKINNEKKERSKLIPVQVHYQKDIRVEKKSILKKGMV